MGIADTSIAALSAALSGGAAVAAWQASREANKTAGSVAQIERDRWHRELSPQLKLKIDPNNHFLCIRFVRPAALGRIQVSLRVRDDRDRSQDPELAGSVTAQMRAEVVWGPYRFRPGIDHADDLGRAVKPFTLEPDDLHRVAIDPTLRPTWFDGASGETRWREKYRNAPMRVWATCEASDHKPWRLSCELPWNGRWARTEAPSQA
ncbi:hypothetical protein OHT59_40145 [Streptomyces sp. NBC_00243]|uniref:hypothetical protein n=1 Tax=Streptomyces sp. NBC_00243 TaxID=2975688 RepID=UPI002DDB1E0C|nr:hypothetical protein [Streptomyces sp. NBC_00243]WRZ24287.1 hypothetical protein OHT59_40145 [Streptomyces sp. NBC_00243]